jgi:type II secretory pathway pseudopilin PulG
MKKTMTAKMTVIGILGLGLLASGCGKGNKADLESTVTTLRNVRVAAESAQSAAQVKNGMATQQSPSLTNRSTPSYVQLDSRSESYGSAPSLTNNSGSSTFKISSENSPFSLEATLNVEKQSFSFKYALKSDDLKNKQDVDTLDLNIVMSGSDPSLAISGHSKTQGNFSLVDKIDIASKNEKATINVEGKVSEIEFKANDQGEMEMRLNGEKLSSEQQKQLQDEITKMGAAMKNMMSTIKNIRS